MRNYEFTVIFEANEEETAGGLARVLEELNAANVVIVKQEDMGIRNLAYPIRNKETGHYYYFELQADPSVINNFSNSFKLIHPVLRFLFVSKDDV